MQRWRMSKSMEKLLTQCRSYSRKGAKTQSLPGSKWSLRLPLRLCVFAGEIFLLLIVLSPIANAQPKPLSEQAASTAMTALWRDSGGYPSRWTYDHGLVLKGIERVYIATGDKQYLDFIQRSMDHFVNDDGSIRTYKLDEYNIDNINPGRNLLFLYKKTGQEKYRKAAALLREQLKTHPRTSDGGFWHKKIYPSQMWLDGLFMGEPFYAEYAATFK